MGYDDNTPLTGVSGGGLPTEIWKEVMERVHEGLPVRPLPMIMPAPAVVEAPPVQQYAPARKRQPQNPISLLDQVLRDIFGGGSSGGGGNSKAGDR
jgi:membrane peptidoglycan carboxypeptidase